MTNLIINGIDHGKFYIEWAKRGGVIREYSQLCKYVCPSENYSDIREGQDGEILREHEQNVGLVYFDGAISENAPYYLRMATPSECADAGIDYIEPPMMWRDIESAPVGKRLILFLKTIVTEFIYIGGYSDGEWLTEEGKVTNTPHGWMPLPHPPKDE